MVINNFIYFVTYISISGRESVNCNISITFSNLELFAKKQLLAVRVCILVQLNDFIWKHIELSCSTPFLPQSIIYFTFISLQFFYYYTFLIPSFLIFNIYWYYLRVITNLIWLQISPHLQLRDIYFNMLFTQSLNSSLDIVILIGIFQIVQCRARFELAVKLNNLRFAFPVIE